MGEGVETHSSLQRDSSANARNCRRPGKAVPMLVLQATSASGNDCGQSGCVIEWKTAASRADGATKILAVQAAFLSARRILATWRLHRALLSHGLNPREGRARERIRTGEARLVIGTQPR